MFNKNQRIKFLHKRLAENIKNFTMEKTEKLIQIIKLQSEIIKILSRVYTSDNRSPYEKEHMWKLLRNLENLEKESIE